MAYVAVAPGTTVRSASALTETSVPQPVVQDGSAQAVLYRFATLSGNVSVATAPERERALAELAADGLAARLHTSPRQATLAAARGLPSGGKQLGTVTSLQLAPAHSNRQTGVVILSEQLSPNPTGSHPTPVVYTAALAKTPAGWRVTSFQPVVPTG